MSVKIIKTSFVKISYIELNTFMSLDKCTNKGRYLKGPFNNHVTLKIVFFQPQQPMCKAS